MLVPVNERLRAERESGSALISVLIIMLVLSIGGLALASIVTNTTGMIVDTRSQVQSRAAADAGLADVVSQLKRKAIACPVAPATVIKGPAAATVPNYKYTVACSGGFATVSVFADVDGARTGVQARYIYSETPATGGDMVFFGTGNVTFTSEVKTSASGRLLNIVMPQASFTCQALIPGNITAKGDVKANGGCTIKGAVTAGGVLDMCCGSDTIEGNVTTSGTSGGTVRGTLQGSLHTNGRVEFGWEGKQVAGSVTANGDVQLGNVRIGGVLTMPAAKTLTQQSGVIVGGTVRPGTVGGPAAPVLPSWFEYKFKQSDWVGFTPVTLAASGSGPGTCSYFTSSPGAGWQSLSTYTTPIVLDARACTSLSANNGSNPVLSIKTNIVLLAKEFDLTALTIKAAAGLSAKPKVWIMTEDANPADNAPTCVGGNIGINGTIMDASIKAMAYTPCVINVAGKAAGISDSWNGSFYGGGWNYGGGLTFIADPIGLPGMGIDESGGAGTPGIGSLVSQRDTVWQDVG